MTLSKIGSLSEASVEDQAEENHVQKLPDEILAYIFKFLDTYNQLLTSQVCKKWKSVYDKELKKLGPFVIFSENLETKFEKLIALNSEKYSLFPLTEEKMLILGFEKRIEYFAGVQDQKVVCQKPSHEHRRLIDQTDQFFFCSYTSYILECFSIETGERIFELDLVSNLEKAIEEKNRPFFSRSSSDHQIKAFTVLSKNPLSFLTVTSGGYVAKWVWEGGSLRCIDYWNIFQSVDYKFPMLQTSQKSIYFADVRGSYLFVCVRNPSLKQVLGYFDDSPIDLVAYSLDSKKQYLGSDHPHAVPYADSLFFDQTYTRGISCKKFDGKFTTIWEFAGPVKRIVDATEKLLLLTNDTEIILLNAKNGKLIKKLAFSFEEGWKGKFYKNFNLLLITFAHKIVIVDLKTDKFFEKSFDPQKTEIIDSHLLGNRLFIYSKENASKQISLGLLEFSLPSNKPTEPVTPDPTIKVDMLQKPSESKPDVPADNLRAKATKDSKNPSRITVLVLGMLALTCLSLSLYFGIHRGINLSIGLGVGSALLGFGSLYSGMVKKLA